MSHHSRPQKSAKPRWRRLVQGRHAGSRQGRRRGSEAAPGVSIIANHGESMRSIWIYWDILGYSGRYVIYVLWLYMIHNSYASCLLCLLNFINIMEFDDHFQHSKHDWDPAWNLQQLKLRPLPSPPADRCGPTKCQRWSFLLKEEATGRSYKQVMDCNGCLMTLSLW